MFLPKAAFAACALALTLSACGGGGGRSTAAGDRWDVPPRLCLPALDRAGAAFAHWPNAPESGACGVKAPVTLAGTAGVAAITPVVGTSCTMALATTRLLPVWDRLARRHLGSGVAAVRHYGSHSCRRMRGGGSMSLHATGEAFDLSGFALEDGREITITDGWWGPRRERRFLRAAAKAACAEVNLVLTPETDANHRDHLHLDLGPWRRCDA